MLNGKVLKALEMKFLLKDCKFPYAWIVGIWLLEYKSWWTRPRVATVDRCNHSKAWGHLGVCTLEQLEKGQLQE